MHRYNAHCQSQCRTQSSHPSTLDFAYCNLANIEVMKTAVSKVLLIGGSSFIELLITVKIHSKLLIGPFLVAKVTELHIDRYLLLPRPFK